MDEQKRARRVRLTFNRETTGPVYVAGTFNDWSTEATPMRRGKDGAWAVNLSLEPGRYEFRYFCDGRWFTDFDAGEVASNPFGDFNSLLSVAAPRRGGRKPK